MTAFGDRVSIGDGGADWFYATNDGLGNFSSVNSERDIIVSGSVTITDVLQLDVDNHHNQRHIQNPP